MWADVSESPVATTTTGVCGLRPGGHSLSLSASLSLAARSLIPSRDSCCADGTGQVPGLVGLGCGVVGVGCGVVGVGCGVVGLGCGVVGVGCGTVGLGCGVVGVGCGTVGLGSGVVGLGSGSVGVGSGHGLAVGVGLVVGSVGGVVGSAVGSAVSVGSAVGSAVCVYEGSTGTTRGSARRAAVAVAVAVGDTGVAHSRASRSSSNAVITSGGSGSPSATQGSRNQLTSSISRTHEPDSFTLVAPGTAAGLASTCSRLAKTPAATAAAEAVIVLFIHSPLVPDVLAPMAARHVSLPMLHPWRG